MCEIMEELRDESINTGIQIGRAEERRSLASELIQQTGFSAERIAQLTKLSLEEVESLMHQQNSAGEN